MVQDSNAKEEVLQAARQRRSARGSESRQRVVAHCRGGRETWLAQGGIREHDAFLGHEMRSPAGTGRGGVSMAEGREGQGARNDNDCFYHYKKWFSTLD